MINNKASQVARLTYSTAASFSYDAVAQIQDFLHRKHKASILEKNEKNRQLITTDHPGGGPTPSVQRTTNEKPSRQLIVPIVDFRNQTVEICPIEHIRRSTVIGNESLWRFMYRDARTVYEGFRRGLKVSNDGPCLGHRTLNSNGVWDSEYKWETYSQVLNRSENVARGLLVKGARPGQQTLIGIYSANRPEVVISEQGCYYFSMIVVSLYDTLGADACKYILDQTELEIVVCDRPSRAENLLSQKRNSPNSKLRTIILMDQPTDALLSSAYDCGVEIVLFHELERLGSKEGCCLPPIFPMYPEPHHLATICYTSGTSGHPKGAMITHENIMAATTGSHMLRTSRIRPGDVMLSYLPMAHMYERLAQAIFLSSGGAIGFSRSDIKLLPSDIKTLRPHMIPSVPRLLNLLYNKIMLEVGDNVLKKWLLAVAVHAKMSELKRLILSSNTIWDNIVFRKLQDEMGGRIKLILSGSAPTSREVLHVLRAGMSALVLEGYGATETSAAACLTMEGDVDLNHVGIPIPSNEVKLTDVVEMNILASEGRGEVCVRGRNVFQGYYKDPEKTALTLDKDGWLKTGDIGRWNENGTLTLIDRKKYIVKLDQGAYVTPEKIESVYNRTQFVSQSFVYGDSTKPYLVGVVVPEPEVLISAASKRLGLSGISFENLCKNERVIQMVHDDIIMEGHKAGLQTFEQTKRIILDDVPFSIDNGLLTPTLKSRRIALKDKYKWTLAKLYADR